MPLAGRADWTLMTAIHDALRRDLDQLLHATASHAPPLAEAWLAGDPHGQALLDAMDDGRQLLGPLQAMIDDAFTIDAYPGRLRRLLARLRTRLASRLAHEEARRASDIQ